MCLEFLQMQPKENLAHEIPGKPQEKYWLWSMNSPRKILFNASTYFISEKSHRILQKAQNPACSPIIILSPQQWTGGSLCKIF